MYAIECSREILNGDDFLLLLADEVRINPRHPQLIQFITGVNIQGKKRHCFLQEMGQPFLSDCLQPFL